MTECAGSVAAPPLGDVPTTPTGLKWEPNFDLMRMFKFDVYRHAVQKCGCSFDKCMERPI